MTEWYLMKSPTMTSGDESDLLSEYSQDAFTEIVNSSAGDDVEIYNSDLTLNKTVRGIIQNRTQDTQLKTMSRQFLAPIGSCKAGMYIKYANRFWLIVGLVDNNTIYEKVIVTLCNYLLSWVNPQGIIIQRWVNATSASQYNNGETSTSNYFVRSDQLMVLTPDDDECLLLETGARFIIDKRCSIYEREYDDNTISDTSKPVLTYKLTRMDGVLFNYSDSGYMGFMAYQDEKHDNDGYYRIEGKGYWLCDSVEYKVDNDTALKCEIKSTSDTIYSGLGEEIFVAEFYDVDENVINIVPIWSIESNFSDKLTVRRYDNCIAISTNDDSLIDKSFELLLSGENYNTTKKTIYIRAFI